MTKTCIEIVEIILEAGNGIMMISPEEAIRPKFETGATHLDRTRYVAIHWASVHKGLSNIKDDYAANHIDCSCKNYIDILDRIIERSQHNKQAATARYRDAFINRNTF